MEDVKTWLGPCFTSNNHLDTFGHTRVWIWTRNVKTCQPSGLLCLNWRVYLCMCVLLYCCCSMMKCFHGFAFIKRLGEFIWVKKINSQIYLLVLKISCHIYKKKTRTIFLKVDILFKKKRVLIGMWFSRATWVQTTHCNTHKSDKILSCNHLIDERGQEMKPQR